MPASRSLKSESFQVGVILATYNCNIAHLEKQIDSLKNQDFKHWVCLISDDGSSEGCRQQVKRAIAGDKRFIYHTQEQNLGAYHNFEYGVRYFYENTQVTHLAFSDQDDIWRCDKLAILLREIGSQRRVAGSLRSRAD